MTNASTSASVIGPNGVAIAGGVGTVVNDGCIVGTGTSSVGVILFDRGSVTNAATGTVSATSDPCVIITGGVGTVTNAGVVVNHGTHTGIKLSAGGQVTNAATGTISTGGVGVYFQSGAGVAGTVTNAGPKFDSWTPVRTGEN